MKRISLLIALTLVVGCKTAPKPVLIDSGRTLPAGVYDQYACNDLACDVWTYQKRITNARPTRILIPFSPNVPQSFVRYEKVAQ